jgi:hypothetical protein
MSLAFWNNPIVVSAFRVKYRRGPFSSTAMYVLVLAMGGALLHYYRDKTGGYWPHNCFIALIGLQFVVSGLGAVSATSASIKAEVINRTLDFQRIATLSPRDILLGKLFGEPAQSYLLAIATIPLGFLCYLWQGVTLDGLALMYVQLASTTLMMGALGLVTRLDATGRSRSGRNPEWMPFTFAIILLIGSPVVMASGGTALSLPGPAAILGLLTPLPSYYGLVKDDLWTYGLAFFGKEIPFVLVTPVSQLLIAFVCFRCMVRQLHNPLNAPMSRGMAYLVILVVDILTAGVLFDPSPSVLSLQTKIAAFALVHLCIGLLLTFTLTPWRESLHSWVWRFRGRGKRLMDLWFGNRSVNGLALATLAAIGVVDSLLLIVLPEVGRVGAGALANDWPVLVNVSVTGVLVLLTFGTLYQWFAFLAGRGTIGLTLTFITLTVALPHILGYNYEIEWLLILSPSLHFGRWLFAPQLPSNLIPMLLLYGIALVLVGNSLHSRMRVLEKIVDRKLAKMGAIP